MTQIAPSTLTILKNDVQFISWSDLIAFHTKDEINRLRKYLNSYYILDETHVVYYMYCQWVQEDNNRIILPEWVSRVISQIAYEDGHSAGESEVDAIRESMEYDFLESYKNYLASNPKV